MASAYPNTRPSHAPGDRWRISLLPRYSRRHGFTLIELLVLMIVIGIIGCIIIPQILGATRRANEAALRGDLRTFRVAIERFQADCGAFPPQLNDIMVWNGEHISGPVDGLGRSVDRSAYRGPYLRTGDMLLPFDPFTDRRDWNYDSATGEVHSSNDGVGRNGIPYSQW
jgi:prepilin-type N-terminal cleavage/methylation domain-containing protein